MQQQVVYYAYIDKGINRTPNVLHWEIAMNRYDFGQIVEDYRISLGLGQAAFGKRFGTTQQSVANWERGSIPSSKVLVEVCKELGLDPLEVSRLRLQKKDKRPNITQQVTGNGNALAGKEAKVQTSGRPAATNATIGKLVDLLSEYASPAEIKKLVEKYEQRAKEL